MNTLLSAISIEARNISNEVQSIIDGQASDWIINTSLNQRLGMIDALGFLKENLQAVRTWSSAQQAVLDGMLSVQEALPDSYRVMNMQSLPPHLIQDGFPEQFCFLVERSRIFLEWVIQIETVVAESRLSNPVNTLAA